MSVLTVHNMPGNQLDISGLQISHNAWRTIVFEAGGANDFVDDETITFGTSGCTGKVESWDSGTLTLVYFLVTAPTFKMPSGAVQVYWPQVGESVTGATANHVIKTDTSDGDTFANDNLTFLFVTNASGAARNIVIRGAKACSQGHLHDSLFTVADGFSGPVGPFSRFQFNTLSTGILRVEYVGSVLNTDIGIAAIRLFNTV